MNDGIIQGYWCDWWHKVKKLKDYLDLLWKHYAHDLYDDLGRLATYRKSLYSLALHLLASRRLSVIYAIGVYACVYFWFCVVFVNGYFLTWSPPATS